MDITDQVIAIMLNAVPRTNKRCATLSRRIAAARGDAPADIVLRNARLVDVLSGGIRPAEIAVVGDSVAGVGSGYRARAQLDLGGRFVCPGLIDAHVHMESSLVLPREFARAVVPRGVTTVVMNPHEIANVLGVPGIRYLMREADAAPFHVFVTVPSCVPATRLATAGAQLSVSDLLPLLSDPRVVGLGEVMDFPGVVAGDARVLEEIAAFEGRPVDGHCPGLGGRKLNAYVAAGISSDHECVTPEEAWEKLRLGMRIFLREGSTARNLKSLLPVLTPENERWIAFCTDDRQPKDLLEEGSIDHLVRTAIASGVAPVRALRMATMNPAEHYRLFDRGIVAPGYRADMMIFRDLSAPRAEMVFHGGVAVASDGAMLPRETKEAEPGREIPPGVRDTVRVDWRGVDFGIPSGNGRIRVIGIVPDQLITESLVMEPGILHGRAVADPERDLLKIAVIERHRASGRIGLGFVRGMGLRRGAVAGTVAHDHHNLLVVGADDESMETAARAVAQAGGGLAAADGEKVLASLPLPIGGLLSEEPIEAVRDRMEDLLLAARRLGSPLRDPFTTMSFLGLEVIPSLKITDFGLVDVPIAKVVPLFVSR